MKITILLCSFFLINILIAEGQILYTDVIPDSTILAPSTVSSNISEFDINQDGTPDFRLTTRFWSDFVTHHCCFCYSNGIGGIDTLFKISWRDSGVVNGPMCTNVALDSGAIIDDRYRQERYTYLNYDCPPDFLDCHQPTPTKYYGIKFYFSGDYHFGWVRLKSDDYHVTIFDMAINLNPNQPIQAGQVTVDVFELGNFKKLEIYPTITYEQIQIVNNSSIKESIILYNTFGQLERVISIPTFEKINLDISTLKTGVYFLISSDTRSSTKIIKL